MNERQAMRQALRERHNQRLRNKLLAILIHLVFYATSFYVNASLIYETGRPQAGIYGGEWLMPLLTYPLILFIAKVITAITNDN